MTDISKSYPFREVRPGSKYFHNAVFSLIVVEKPKNTMIVLIKPLTKNFVEDKQKSI